VESVCLTDRRSFKAAITQIDALIVDIFIQWEKYLEITREVKLTIDLWIKAKVAGTEEEIPVHIQKIQTLKQKWVQYKKAALKLHAEMLKVIRQVSVREQEVKVCLKRRCRDCPMTSMPVSEPMVSMPRERVVSMPREQTQVAVRTAEPADCGTLCSQRGMSTQPPSSSGIMSQLQQYRCVSGANIKMQTATIGQCKCYGQPQININQARPICKNTPCGDVPCDGQAQCPCPDKPNCVLTVTCSWGGWREIKPFTYQPILGAK